MGGKNAETGEEQKSALDSVEEALVGHEASDPRPESSDAPPEGDRPPVPGHRSP
jgi:hypothetical protein